MQEGWAHDNVVVDARVAAKRDQHFNVCLRVVHVKLDGPARRWPCCPVRENGVEATAGEVGRGVVVEAAGWWPVEKEVGGGERQKGEEGEDAVHGYCVGGERGAGRLIGTMSRY